MWTVPQATDRERKDLSWNKHSFRGLAPNFKRGKAVFERNTHGIIRIDVFGEELFHLGTGSEVLAIQTFSFKVPKKSSIFLSQFPFYPAVRMGNAPVNRLCDSEPMGGNTGHPDANDRSKYYRKECSKWID